jgi:hypothetical protein
LPILVFFFFFFFVTSQHVDARRVVACTLLTSGCDSVAWFIECLLMFKREPVLCSVKAAGSSETLVSDCMVSRHRRLQCCYCLRPHIFLTLNVEIVTPVADDSYDCIQCFLSKR